MADSKGYATAFLRRDKVLIYTMAPLQGGAHTSDFDTFSALHRLTDDSQALGASVRSALLKYKTTPIPMGGRGDYNLELARKMGLRSAGTLYNFSRYCGLAFARGQITFAPQRRRFRGWEPFPESFKKGHEDIVVPFDCIDSKLGEALRECISRSV